VAGSLAPCFFPATLLAAGAVHKVSLTRLGAEAAQLSGDVPCAIGERLQLEMDRPTDGQRIRVLVRVTAVHREGVQWGWKPSIHVGLEQPLERALVITESEEPLPDEPVVEIEADEDLREVADGPSYTEDESFSFEETDAGPDLASITLPEFEDSIDGDDQEPEILPEVIEPQVHTLDDIVAEPEPASTSAESSAPWATAEITPPPGRSTTRTRARSRCPPAWTSSRRDRPPGVLARRPRGTPPRSATTPSAKRGSSPR